MEELYHHGILGQKWGVRRYQNADGSLTSAGKRRYDTGEAKDKIKRAKKEYKSAYKEYSKDFNDAYDYTSRHFITSNLKGNRRYDVANSKWDKAYDSLVKEEHAKNNYKLTKAENKRTIYDVNSDYYNKKAEKYEKKEETNRALASMNKAAYDSQGGKGLIAKANAVNAKYYENKADKLESKANRNRAMASMNEYASQQKKEERVAKAKASIAKNHITSEKITNLRKSAVNSGMKYTVDVIRQTKQ